MGITGQALGPRGLAVLAVTAVAGIAPSRHGWSGGMPAGRRLSPPDRAPRHRPTSSRRPGRAAHPRQPPRPALITRRLGPPRGRCCGSSRSPRIPTRCGQARQARRRGLTDRAVGLGAPPGLPHLCHRRRHRPASSCSTLLPAGGPRICRRGHAGRCRGQHRLQPGRRGPDRHRRAGEDSAVSRNRAHPASRRAAASGPPRPTARQNLADQSRRLTGEWAPTVARVLLGLVLARFGYHELCSPRCGPGTCR